MNNNKKQSLKRKEHKNIKTYENKLGNLKRVFELLARSHTF